MYKSEVEHQRYICHDQGDSDKNYFGELPAGMFHLPLMFTECFTPSERNHYGQTNHPAEKAQYRRKPKRYE